MLVSGKINRGKGKTRVTFLEQQAIFGTIKGDDQVVVLSRCRL